MSLSNVHRHTPPFVRRLAPKRETIMVSKRDQARLDALKAADFALRRDMKRLNVRFD